MSKEFKTGVIALLVIILFIWGYNFLKGQDIFSVGAKKFYIEYANVNGLKKSSPVTINGYAVGKVSDIKFNDKPEKKGTLIVEVLITEDFEFSKNSIAKIESAGIMGGQNLAIIPNYEGKPAESGDFLKGQVASDMLATITNQIGSTQGKLDKVLINADSLLVGINQVLDEKARKSLNRTTVNLEKVVNQFTRTLTSVNSVLDNSKGNIETTFSNTKKITDDFSKISSELAQAELGKTTKKLEETLTNVNILLAKVKEGKGTLGKLVTDDKMYTNLTNASKELEELLREMKLNPKRFVHFSLFGKRPKPYNKEKNNKGVSN